MGKTLGEGSAVMKKKKRKAKASITGSQKQLKSQELNWNSAHHLAQLIPEE